MEIKSLFSLIGKNLKIFFRSKVSSVVVLLIPFLIVMFTGFAFNSSQLSNVQVGVYCESYNDFTNGIIGDFEQKGFASNRYFSVESCVESVKYSDSQICIIFPANLDPDITDEEIVFYVDYSRVNLADNLVNEVQGSLLVKTTNISEGMAQNLIDSLENVKNALPNTKIKVNDVLSNANKNRNIDLDTSVDDISWTITELEDIKSDIDANETRLRANVENVLVKLREVEKSEIELSSNLNSLSEGQNEVVIGLGETVTDLDKIILSLNSRKNIGADNIASPVKTKIEPINVDYNNKDYITPIMLSLIVLFSAILLASTFVLKEKKTKAFFRNFMTPTKNITFLLSTYLTCLIIISVQFLLVFIGMKYILKIDIIPILAPLAVVLIATILVFISIGIFIGYLFRSDETIIFSSMIVAALFMFFSNVILPLENISGGLMKFLKFNPLVVSDLALKKIILFKFGFGAITNELLVLGGFIIIFFILNVVFRKFTQRSWK